MLVNDKQISLTVLASMQDDGLAGDDGDTDLVMNTTQADSTAYQMNQPMPRPVSLTRICAWHGWLGHQRRFNMLCRRPRALFGAVDYQQCIALHTRMCPLAPLRAGYALAVQPWATALQGCYVLIRCLIPVGAGPYREVSWVPVWYLHPTRVRTRLLIITVIPDLIALHLPAAILREQL